MSQLPAPIQRFIDATNQGDSDAFVAAFAPNASLTDYGRVFHGAEGARSWDASDNIGKRSRFDVVAFRQEAGEWIVTVDVSGDGFTGRSDIRFAIDGDLISRMVIAP
jgi:hypothetical protein